jgi:hypothetical protein
VPLHTELVGRLRPWLASKCTDRSVWPGKRARDKQAGVVLKKDLATARAAWPAESDPAERGVAGVRPKEAQALAKHSTITLTMDRYAHTGLHDVSLAVESLPALPASSPESAPATLKATGTENASASTDHSVCTGFAHAAATGDSG